MFVCSTKSFSLLCGLLLIAALITAIVLFVQNQKAETEIDDVEGRLEKLEEKMNKKQEEIIRPTTTAGPYFIPRPSPIVRPTTTTTTPKPVKPDTPVARPPSISAADLASKLPGSKGEPPKGPPPKRPPPRGPPPKGVPPIKPDAGKDTAAGTIDADGVSTEATGEGTGEGTVTNAEGTAEGTVTNAEGTAEGTVTKAEEGVTPAAGE